VTSGLITTTGGTACTTTTSVSAPAIFSAGNSVVVEAAVVAATATTTVVASLIATSSVTSYKFKTFSKIRTPFKDSFFHELFKINKLREKYNKYFELVSYRFRHFIFG
jgi:hypothetical protein